MKKIFILSIITTIATSLHAQDAGLPPRAMTQAEQDRWAWVCNGFNKAMPKTFLDYTMKKDDCNSFDWAETRNGKPLTVTNKKNEPIGNQPNFTIWFTMSDDSVKAKEDATSLEILDAKNDDGTFDQKKLSIASAKSDKLIECKTLRVHVAANLAMSIAKQYEKSTKPVKLNLTNNLFAYLYLFPEGRQVAEEGASIGTDGQAFYKDKAVVVIGKQPKVTAVPPCNCTWREEKISFTDNISDVTTAPIKNIVVEIDGFEKDVRAMITKIDWAVLQAMLNK